MMTLFAHPILIAAAVIPAVALMIRIYRADRLEREPPGLLLGLLLRGVLATVLALLAERLGNFLLRLFVSDFPLLYRLLLCFVVVGGAGLRYTVRIGRSTTCLYLEENRWFVERRGAEA